MQLQNHLQHPEEYYILSVTFVSATPNTAQFVVISGKIHTQAALYRAGMDFFKNISTNCTRCCNNKNKYDRL